MQEMEPHCILSIMQIALHIAVGTALLPWLPWCYRTPYGPTPSPGTSLIPQVKHSPLWRRNLILFSKSNDHSNPGVKKKATSCAVM